MSKKELNNEIYRFIFDNSMEAIFLTNPNGEVYAVNNAACDMLDKTEKEILELGRGGVIDLTDERLPAMLQEREKNNQVKGELRIVKGDSTFPGLVTSKIFVDENGDKFTVTIIRDLSSEKELERKYKTDSTMDELTQVLNRRGFIEKLNESLSDSTLLQFGLLMIDIDRFKQINDEHGHIQGDIILQKLALQLSLPLRQLDFIGRFGGDEFIVFLYNTSKDQMINIANRLLHQVQESGIKVCDTNIEITVSIGAQYFENEDILVNQVFSIVDNHMYKAKKHRNTVYYES